jgi:hypothetical protein
MDALQKRFPARRPKRSFTAPVFWRLRRAAISTLGVKRQSITPGSDLISMVGSDWKTSHRWHALGKTAGLKLPGLEYSSAWSIWLLLIGIIPSLVLAVAGSPVWAVLLSIVVGMPLTCTVMFHVLRRFATEIPIHISTMGNLAVAVAGLNYGKLAVELGCTSDRELKAALYAVIADVIGPVREEILKSNPTLLDLVLVSEGLRGAV